MKNMESFKVIVFVCLCLNSFDQGLSKSAYETTNNDANNDYFDNEYDYDEDYDSKPNVLDYIIPSTNKEIILNPPYFEQSDMVQNANSGDDVLINCDVRNFQIRNVVVWYKNSTVIANGQYVINHRIETMKNNSIRIKNVQVEDAGDYYCEVLPDMLRLHVDLKVGGRLAILSDGRDVTDRSITLRQGGTLSFECKTFGKDELSMKWFFNGQRVENVVTKINAGLMFIENIDAEHAGVYQCLGDDGTQDPPHGMITIEVHYEPKVSTNRHHVNTEAGTTAELYCDYKANPIAVTRWLKNGKEISYSDKYFIKNIINKDSNRTILTVNNINTTDLGEYDCEAKNAIGHNEIKIYLIFEPEKALFEDIEIDGNKVTLYWLVRSIQPLSEAVLDYQLTGAYTWSSVSIIHTRRHTELSGFWKVTHIMELTPGHWHTRVKTKNRIGWSEFSVQYDFDIKDENDIEQLIDEMPPDDIVMKAGVGVGNSNGNSGSLKTFSYCSLLFALLFQWLF